MSSDGGKNRGESLVTEEHLFSSYKLATTSPFISFPIRLMQSALLVDPFTIQPSFRNQEFSRDPYPEADFSCVPPNDPVTETVCTRVRQGKTSWRATHLAHRVWRPTDASCCRNGASDGPGGDGGVQQKIVQLEPLDRGALWFVRTRIFLR